MISKSIDWMHKHYSLRPDRKSSFCIEEARRMWEQKRDAALTHASWFERKLEIALGSHYPVVRELDGKFFRGCIEDCLNEAVYYDEELKKY